MAASRLHGPCESLAAIGNRRAAAKAARSRRDAAARYRVAISPCAAAACQLRPLC
ncbi:hypothetical protein ACFOPN_00480 [Xanthomonas hyacinthi]|uniref:hypothetical protein n=1 Tax=Xanthomonas hyacinthi TaxID=56455 RepID=UPI000A82C21D